MTTFLFDVALYGSLRVKASSEEEALENLKNLLDCAAVNFGSWPDGSPATGEVSLYDKGFELVDQFKDE